MKRRTFALGSASVAAGIALDSALPGRWMQSVARELNASAAHPTNDRILVVLQLSGGNDGLNTVIPYRDELYLKARPNLKIDAASVLSVTPEMGFHPSMKDMADSFESGRLSVVQGVGYASPNRSHFESMDIWHSCQTKQERHGNGWLGRYLAASANERDSTDAPGLHIGGEALPLALVDRQVQVPSIASIEQMRLKKPGVSEPTSLMNEGPDPVSDPSGLLGFVSTSTASALAASERLEKAMATPDQSGDFPSTGLGERLKIISRLILSGLGTRIYYVTFDGFDTHANQPDAHAGLLRQWSEASGAFCKSMQRAGQQDRVLLMTFSEFGRRVSENASQGTDHGAAAPMFFAGPELATPIVGEQPSLSDLEDGDLRFHTDFRDVYATVVQDWLGGSGTAAVDDGVERPSRPLKIFRS